MCEWAPVHTFAVAADVFSEHPLWLPFVCVSNISFHLLLDMTVGLSYATCLPWLKTDINTSGDSPPLCSAPTKHTTPH